MELNEPEFERNIAEIDAEYSHKEVKVSARPFSAVVELLKKMNASGPLTNPHGENLNFPVTARNACDHVHNWYESTYGELLNVDFSPASFPIWISGHAYEVKLPLAFGVTVVSSKHTFTDKRVVNGVDFVQKLPPKIREGLTGEEENLIQAMYATCIGVADEFKKIKSELIRSARDDSLVSCQLLCGFNINASLSSWHSLQFAEKCLKELISRNGNYSKTHSIDKLVKEAMNVGYIPDERIDWSLFRFKPSVRYEPDAVSIESGAKINHEAWRIAYNTLKQINA
jgi:hypothetical protein